MRRHHRATLTAAALATSLALVGCETADMMDKLQDMIPFGDNKKPLKGERKEVFPGGVPGVPQGVPPDMVKGNQPPPDATPPPPQAAIAPPPAEKPKPKKKLQAKPQPPPAPAPDQSAATAQPVQPTQQPAWPPPMQPASGWPTQPPPAQPAR
jgi:outer membrane biosynthesis protein TonB